jgi:hypothetical protein
MNTSTLHDGERIDLIQQALNILDTFRLSWDGNRTTESYRELAKVKAKTKKAFKKYLKNIIPIEIDLTYFDRMQVHKLDLNGKMVVQYVTGSEDTLELINIMALTLGLDAYRI